MPAVGPARAGDEVDRAGRHRRRDQAHVREHGKDGSRYVSCPEFLKEGTAVDGLPAARPRRGRRRRRLGRRRRRASSTRRSSAPLVRTDVASAEMVKLASNAFLATKISFINEIANVCEEIGADVVEVARGMGLDERIGPKFLQAGHRLRRLAASPRTSARSSSSPATRGYHFQLLNAVIEVNELQKRRVIGKLQKHLGSLVGKRVALLGLAFKPNTDDMREASSLVLAARLQAEGATVARLRPGRRGAGARAAAGRRVRRLARSRRSTAPTPPCS